MIKDNTEDRGWWVLEMAPSCLQEKHVQGGAIT